MYQYFGCCERRQCHFVWQGVFMGAGGAVHCVCTAPSRPRQKQRIFTVLQTDARTKIPANQCTFCRYICSLTVHVDGWFSHKMALMRKISFCVSRECAFAACNSCSFVTHCAHLHAPQHPWVGTPGGSAMSILLHRYGELSHHFFHNKNG